MITDCNRASDFDAVKDGFDSIDHGGEDCDDANSEIHPEAEKIWYDNVDQNCDGWHDHDADMDGFKSIEFSSLRRTELTVTTPMPASTQMQKRSGTTVSIKTATAMTRIRTLMALIKRRIVMTRIHSSSPMQTAWMRALICLKMMGTRKLPGVDVTPARTLTSVVASCGCSACLVSAGCGAATAEPTTL